MAKSRRRKQPAPPDWNDIQSRLVAAMNEADATIDALAGCHDCAACRALRKGWYRIKEQILGRQQER
jgi:hypothetical protein